jgi:hypothetical protein
VMSATRADLRWTLPLGKASNVADRAGRVKECRVKECGVPSDRSRSLLRSASRIGAPEPAESNSTRVVVGVHERVARRGVMRDEARLESGEQVLSPPEVPIYGMGCSRCALDVGSALLQLPGLREVNGGPDGARALGWRR